MLLLIPLIGYELDAIRSSLSKYLGAGLAMVSEEFLQRLLVDCLIWSPVLLKDPCPRKKITGSVHLICVPTRATSCSR